jgi:hypothetical protein
MRYVRTRSSVPAAQTLQIPNSPTNPNPIPQTTPTTTSLDTNSLSRTRTITNEYYNNFGSNKQNATNTADFFGVG